ncbi:ankyrin repeat-containing domain protein [Coprinopsis sp. MPI-PUGE-AT-0042]|nr:ankyrin repeat-containing domain protein [Coprinopsis sp. MPI-PUGE-AT-0042]
MSVSDLDYDEEGDFMPAVQKSRKAKEESDFILPVERIIQPTLASAHGDPFLLLKAASKGWLANIRKIDQEHEVDLNTSNDDGETLLILAARNGHATVVKFLLARASKPSPPNQRGKDGKKGKKKQKDKHRDESSTQFTVNVNARTKAGETALIALARGSALIGPLPSTDKTEDRFATVARLLLGCRFTDVNAADSSGETALMIAAAKGKDQLVSLLLEHPKIRVNMSNPADGASALFRAAVYGKETCVALILQHNDLNMSRRNRFGETVLMKMCSKPRQPHHEGDTVIAQQESHINPETAAAIVDLLLLSTFCDVNYKDKFGVTSLMRAAMWGQVAIVEMLLSCHDIEVNACDCNGQTALMKATQSGHEDCVAALLAVPGIDILIRDGKGKDALRFARARRHTNVIDLLASHGN